MFVICIVLTWNKMKKMKNFKKRRIISTVMYNVHMSPSEEYLFNTNYLVFV